MKTCFFSLLNLINLLNVVDVVEGKEESDYDTNNTEKKDQKGVIEIVNCLLHCKRIELLFSLNCTKRSKLWPVCPADKTDSPDKESLNSGNDAALYVLTVSPVAHTHDYQREFGKDITVLYGRAKFYKILAKADLIFFHSFSLSKLKCACFEKNCGRL